MENQDIHSHGAAFSHPIPMDVKFVFSNHTVRTYETTLKAPRSPAALTGAVTGSDLFPHGNQSWWIGYFLKHDSGNSNIFASDYPDESYTRDSLMLMSEIHREFLDDLRYAEARGGRHP